MAPRNARKGSAESPTVFWRVDHKTLHLLHLFSVARHTYRILGRTILFCIDLKHTFYTQSPLPLRKSSC
ncbi:hypothetical protein L208DRAFT_1396326 [Tricholoma matsutake]|nr:hypothetical protein L208DRAFT_1396326 [Tricholoma matsutake 945]